MVETMTTRRNVLLGAAFGVLAGAGAVSAFTATGAPSGPAKTFEVNHTDEEWRRLLSPAAYDVLRNAGTEQPYSSPLNDEHRPGTFTCAGCGQALFSSSTKFDSGTGWPSFWQPLPKAVNQRVDTTLGMSRDEVHCRRCGGHLGHVFDDGPRPTGLRYCMNGVALAFTPA
jgi:peptide-methionine (R)-S-oxide reductase